VVSLSFSSDGKLLAAATDGGVKVWEAATGEQRQFTHGAWSELKTANSRRRIPLAKELLRQLRLHRLRTQRELVFPGARGKTDRLSQLACASVGTSAEEGRREGRQRASQKRAVAIW
jgi:integrase